MNRRVGISATMMALALALPLVAQRGDDSKRKSKNGKTEGTVAGVAVVVEYGRPSVGGRAIWGALVPYGQVWRAGADEATTISFDRDVKIEGQALPKGTYALFTIPGESSWTVIFSKTAKQWGAYDYDAKQDALREKARAERLTAYRQRAMMTDAHRATACQPDVR